MNHAGLDDEDVDECDKKERKWEYEGYNHDRLNATVISDFFIFCGKKLLNVSEIH